MKSRALSAAPGRPARRLGGLRPDPADAALDRGRPVPALRHRRVPRDGGRQDGRPHPASGAGAVHGRRQARAPELLGRAAGQLREGRGHRPVVQVPRLGRRLGADDLPVRVPALDRAGLLQAEARPRRARRQADRRGVDRRLGARGRQRLFAGRRPGRGLDASRGRGDRDRRRGRPGDALGGRLEAEDHAARARDARSGSCGWRPTSSRRSPRSSSTSRTSSSCARSRPPVLGRDRPRRGAAQADRPGRRLRRLGPAHRRGRLGHQPGKLAPGRQDPAQPRSRPPGRSASRSSSSRSRAAWPSRSSST